METPLAPARERLGRLAVMNGFITLQQLEEALAEQDEQAGRTATPDRLGRILVRRGWIDEQALEGLLRIQAAGAAPTPDFARYEVRRHLGEGAMAVVYEALDRQLGRPVALKVIKQTAALHENARKRLQLEAQALARLSHANVVAVHDYSEEAGRSFVVMELVEGTSLRKALTDKSLETRALLEVLEKVAEGVQHAHEHGIVHRDLKPENILLSPGGVPKVADFGLARLLEDGPALTASGSRHGTPLYMAPEQVEGRNHAVSAKTDVYALGVLLYEILAGRTPFVGETLTEIFAKILSEEPVPLRRLNSRVHADLETITLKALEKDPARRYASAGEFAQELTRYLSGEAIQARRPRILQRAVRRLRKVPFLAGLGVGAVVAMAAGMALWIQRREEARRAQVERDGALDAYRNVARMSLDGALGFRRVGEHDKVESYLPKLEEAYRQAVRLAPDAAELDYLMGRFYRALMRDEEALRSQQQALAKEPDYAPALYERIIFASRRYRNQLQGERNRLAQQKLDPTATPTPPSARVLSYEEVERTRRDFLGTRDRLLSDCERLDRLVSDPARRAAIAPFLSEANVLAAHGILAYTRGRFNEAITLLKEATAKDSLLEEAWETLAEAAHERPFSGPAEREAHAAEAEVYYADGIARDRGYLLHLIGRADFRHLRGDERMCRGEDPLPQFDGAIQDFTAVLRVRETWTNPLRGRGDLLVSRGLYKMGRGEDPTGDFAAAEADFGEILRVRPKTAYVNRRRGVLRVHRARYRILIGEDPTSDLTAAEEDLGEAAAGLRKDSAVWSGLGYLRVQRAAFRMSRSEDPEPDLQGAETDLAEAIRLYPFNPHAWRDLGLVKVFRARLAATRGADPLPILAAAEEDLSRGIDRSKDNPGGWLPSESQPPYSTRGSLKFERGLLLAGRGKDPRQDWEAARQDLETALIVNPKDADACMGLGRLALQWGLWLESRGSRDEAASQFREASRQLSTAVQVNPFLERHLAVDRDRAKAKSQGP